MIFHSFLFISPSFFPGLYQNKTRENDLHSNGLFDSGILGVRNEEQENKTGKEGDHYKDVISGLPTLQATGCSIIISNVSPGFPPGKGKRSMCLWLSAPLVAPGGIYAQYSSVMTTAFQAHPQGYRSPRAGRKKHTISA